MLIISYLWCICSGAFHILNHLSMYLNNLSISKKPGQFSFEQELNLK